MANLSLRLDPSQMKTGAREGSAALDGVKGSAKEAQSAIDLLGKEAVEAGRDIDRGMKPAAAGTKAVATQVATAGKASGRAAIDIRGLSMQLSQVAQSASATGRPLQALAIQLPDIGLSFGTIGIAAGVAAGALLPLAANALSSGEAVKTADEALEDFITSLDSYNRYATEARRSTVDLRAEFGEFAEEIRRYNVLAAQSAAVTAQQALGNDNLDLLSTVKEASQAASAMLEAQRRIQSEIAGGVATTEQIQTLREQLGVATDAAEDAARAVGLTVTEAIQLDAAFTNLRAAESMEQIRDRAGTVLDQIIRIRDESGNISPALAEVIPDLVEVATQAGIAARNAESISTAASSIDFSAAAGTAAALASNLGIALGTASRLMAIQQASGSQDPVVFDPRDPRYDPIAAEMARVRDQAGSVSPFDPSRIPKVTVSKRGGGGGGGGSGSLQQSEATKQALQDITDVIGDATAAWQEFNDIGGSALDRLIDGTGDLKSIMGDLLKDMVKFWAQQRLISQGVGSQGQSLGAMLFGSIFGGSLPSFDGGGWTGSGMRSGGMDGKGGFPALLHPGETVIDHTKGSGMAVPTSGELYLTDNGQIAARIRYEAASAANGAVSTVKGNFGAYMNEFSTRGAVT